MRKATIHLLKPLKFLIVDDSRAIQAIISRAISRCGFEPIEIKTALNGELGLDAIAEFHPDLVITDWYMPRMSGLEMVQAMRQMGHQTVRVGFVTTERNQGLMDEAIRNGAMFILHKPFDDEELVSVVTAAVQDLANSLQSGTVAPATESAVEAPITLADIAAKKALVLVETQSLQVQLAQSLGKIPFRLIVSEPTTQDQLTPQILLGLYGANSRKSVYAIAMLDANTTCMLGGGVAHRQPTDVRAVMATGHPDESMLKHAHEFLRQAAACLTESATDRTTVVTLAKASMVRNTFTKLGEILNQAVHRSDFRLAIPGYGEGRLAFILVGSP